jgi:hypothetical protein
VWNIRFTIQTGGYLNIPPRELLLNLSGRSTGYSLQVTGLRLVRGPVSRCRRMACTRMRATACVIAGEKQAAVAELAHAR